MKKYDSYKDSELSWLGEIPSHWELSRLKNLGKAIIGLTYSPDNIVDANEGILVLRSSNIQNYKVSFKDNVYVDVTPKKSLITKVGDILICSRNGSRALIGKNIRIDKNTENLTFGAFMTIYRSKYFMYLSYFFNSQLFDYQSGAFMTSTINQLTISTLNQLNTIFPPELEQTYIAQYLDTKTHAIDKKVNLLEKKIFYYKELCKSIINETVTKGLDKNTKVKDSGIDWIGQIPEHWEVRRFKSFATTIKGKNLEYFDNNFEGALPNLSLEYLRNECVVFDTFVHTSTKSLIVDENDIIIIWDGAGVGEILKAKKGVISSTIAKLKFHKSFSSKYFYHLRNNLEYTLKQMPTGMGIPHLNPTILKNYMCPIPPLEEQIDIAKYLDDKTQTIDKIISNIHSQISTLKELRKTLINDVITGKIKVTE